MAYTTINKSTEHFNTTTWTGDSTTPKTFTTGTFKPDLLWGKIRSQGYNHQLFDTTRGAGSDKELVTSQSGAEGASNGEVYGYVSAFTSTGFTFTKGSDSAGYDYWNESPDTYAAWTWKANGGTTSSNSDGSITSTVQANTTAGFSIVTYTGTGANATVGHGLGAVPKVVLTKNRSSSNNWAMYHASPGNTRSLPLDLNTYPPTSSAYWNNTTPTSSVFSVSTGNDVNKSGDNMIAYCFAEKPGYSKFGSYTGNGDADGSFVYTGFKPAFVILRRYDYNDNFNWIMLDNKRPGYNVISEQLKPNLGDAEDSSSSYAFADFLSNGFKLRNNASDKNPSGGSIAYLAFGQSLVGSNNVPCTAR